MSPAGRAEVITHRRPDDTAGALRSLLDAARAAGWDLHFDSHEAGKHGIEPGDGIAVGAPEAEALDLCFALGGDGTILTALRRHAGTGVPVFAVNFGEIGYLATVEPEEIDAGLALAFSGGYEVLSLPAIALSGPSGLLAINDVSVHRKQGLRVADLAYAIGEDEVGRVRCDGLVVSTPAGSTGYNLANGGPVMAWGVEGFAVSFIAPHSLTARALVVAPDDVLRIENRSRDEAADLAIDGRIAGELAPGETVELRFEDDQAALAQRPGTSFYHRLREKFGKLAS